MRQKNMSAPTQEWRIEVGATENGERLDRLLARSLRFKSRAELQNLMKQGRVALYSDWGRSEPAEIPRRPATRVRSGQLVIATLDAPFLSREEPSVADVQPRKTLSQEHILYQDDDLIAVDKPAGCAVHPTRTHPHNSLIELLHRWQGTGAKAPATPCHRLDRGTSGVVLFATTSEARRAMGRMFEAAIESVALDSTTRQISKRYLAVVRGCPHPDQGVIRQAIARDRASTIPIRRWVDADGLAAETYYTTLKLDPVRDRSLLSLAPTTGRQHQLRVHLAAMGHPILGDTLYTSDDALFLRSVRGELSAEDLQLLGVQRLALHAESLAFDHPTDGQRVTIHSPLPASLRALVSAQPATNDGSTD